MSWQNCRKRKKITKIHEKKNWNHNVNTKWNNGMKIMKSCVSKWNFFNIITLKRWSTYVVIFVFFMTPYCCLSWSMTKVIIVIKEDGIIYDTNISKHLQWISNAVFTTNITSQHNECKCTSKCFRYHKRLTKITVTCDMINQMIKKLLSLHETTESIIRRLFSLVTAFIRKFLFTKMFAQYPKYGDMRISNYKQFCHKRVENIYWNWWK